MYHVCPNCGYCPHCGRGRTYPRPINPYAQPWVWPKYPWDTTVVPHREAWQYIYK